MYHIVAECPAVLFVVCGGTFEIRVRYGVYCGTPPSPWIMLGHLRRQMCYVPVCLYVCLVSRSSLARPNQVQVNAVRLSLVLFCFSYKELNSFAPSANLETN